MTKFLKNVKTTTKRLKKSFKTFAKITITINHLLKTLLLRKKKQEILFKKIKTLQDQFDNLPKPVTFKQEIAYYNLNANLLSIYLQLSQELYYLNELEKAYKEGYNDAKKER